jgi:hypothetical protein
MPRPRVRNTIVKRSPADTTAPATTHTSRDHDKDTAAATTNAAPTRPSCGYTASFGSRKCSISMADSAMPPATKSSTAGSSGVQPRRQAVRPNNAPVSASING